MADIRTDLRAHLRERMSARDTLAVRAIRAALAAIENAEAVPVDDVSQTELHLAAGGSADVPRRDLSDHEARALVAGEIDDLHDAARRHRALGDGEGADRISAQAEVLRAILGP